LAASVGMTVPQDAPRTPRAQAAARERQQERARQQQWLEDAQAHYVAQLHASREAQQYLKRRGLTAATIEHFGLGWSGSDKRGLARVFAHYDDPDLLESGLVLDGQNGERRDRFRSRIMFPIRNLKGALIGFGGRVIGAGEPKYLNSPETPLFSKGSELYGLWEARQAIRAEGCVLVVEGYMDVVGLAQHGMAHAVATLGTATTEQHVQKLLRASARIVFSFDGDRAGKSAAWRALTVCLPLARDDVSIRFLFLPQGQDPDSYVQEHGAPALRALQDSAMPLSQFLLDELAARHPMQEAEGRAACMAEAQPLLAQLPQGALRLQIERAFAQRVQLTPEELTQALQAPNTRRARPAAQAQSDDSQTQRGSPARARAKPSRRTPPRAAARTVTPLAKRLLRLLLSHPALVQDLDAAQLELLHHTPHLSLVHALVDVIRASGAQHSGAVLQAVQMLDDAPDLRAQIQTLGVETLGHADLPDPQAECRDTLRLIERQAAQAEQNALIQAGLGDQESRDRYQALTTRLAQLK